MLNEHLRLTPISLERAITQKIPKTTKRVFRGALKDLLSDGQLIYTQHFSTTHLEINYNRPFKVSDRIVLSPKEFSWRSDEKEIVIWLNDGTAFGAGDHPTTRMVLRGMDNILRPSSAECDMGIQHALDIGTGSGVLAIAAAVMGVQCVEGIDIDVLACHEAMKNVQLNRCDDSVNISQASLEDFHDRKFDLLVANLRPPTIRELIPAMINISSPETVWIISGCRENEKKRILNHLLPDLSNIIWEENQNNWSAFAVKRSLGLK